MDDISDLASMGDLPEQTRLHLEESRETSVVICDDDPRVLRALALLLSVPGICVLARCASAGECLEAVRQRPPDVVLVDLTLNGKPEAGIALIRAIHQASPRTICLVLTAADEQGQLRNEAFMAGAHGFYRKGYVAGEDLPRIVRKMAGGNWEIEADLARSVFCRVCAPPTPAKSLIPTVASPLTARECEIVQQLAEGARPNAIAESLQVSVPSVYLHIRNITEKCHPRL